MIIASCKCRNCDIDDNIGEQRVACLPAESKNRFTIFATKHPDVSQAGKLFSVFAGTPAAAATPPSDDSVPPVLPPTATPPNTATPPSTGGNGPAGIASLS